MRHGGWVGLVGLVLVSAAMGQDPDVSATYLQTRVTHVSNDGETPEAVVQTAFEITSPGNRWVRLDLEFRLSQPQNLLQPNGKLVLATWNNLFTPVTPKPARWTDCRFSVPASLLESAENLPRASTFVLWASPLVYDWGGADAPAGHVGSGWPARVGLIVETDAAGKVLRLENPQMPGPTVEAPSDDTMPARKAKLTAQHLKPREGLRIYEVYPRAGGKQAVLDLPRRQAWTPTDYGPFFQKIDSADAAKELALWQHAGARLVTTREQYDALAGAVKLAGWTEKDLPVVPETYDIATAEVSGVGWRVTLMALEPGPGRLIRWTHTVTTDGAIGSAPEVIIESGATTSPARQGVYAEALRTVLAGKLLPTIQPPIAPAAKPVDMPIPATRKPAAYLPASKWPKVETPNVETP